MRNHHISPLIRIAFTVITIFALWLGIEEYADIKAMTHDGSLAVLRMVFMMVVVYGSSYILLISGIYLQGRFSKRPSLQTSAGVTQAEYDYMCDQEAQRMADSQNELMKSISDYTTLTFSKVMAAEDIEIIIENITLLADDDDATRNVLCRMNGVTSNDLYHFGWNVGKRLKKSNIQIAWFLKDTFKTMLEDVSVETVQTKLANKEGNFTLKLIPLDQELVPHIFPSAA